jgi:hypothetical protein
LSLPSLVHAQTISTQADVHKESSLDYGLRRGVLRGLLNSLVKHKASVMPVYR